jgi:hypothetical protein
MIWSLPSSTSRENGNISSFIIEITVSVYRHAGADGASGESIIQEFVQYLPAYIPDGNDCPIESK